MQQFSDLEQLMKLKKYSPNTIKTYIGLLSAFKTFSKRKTLYELKDFEILGLMADFILKRKYSYSSQKQFISAAIIYFNDLHQRDIHFFELYPTQKPEYLPTVLSTREIKKLLQNTNNLKHKAVLSTIYGLGLRSGELINLKITDIDGSRKLVYIRASKGNKDRVLMLPAVLHQLLRKYFTDYQPRIYLFNGQNSHQYSAGSIRNILKNACKKSGIKKQVRVHTLRHSFATHLLEQGTDIRIIQKLLGHKSIKTTQIYTQVADTVIKDVKSPLDFL